MLVWRFPTADFEIQQGGQLTLADHLGQAQVPFLDMPANQDALARAIMQGASRPFADLGLSSTPLVVHFQLRPDPLAH